MGDQDDPTYSDRIAQLRKAIDAIESTTAGMVRAPEPAPDPCAERTPNAATPPPALTYVGMPDGDNWMDPLPARYHHGSNGFDRRIMEQLAAIGVRCYTLNDLTKAKTIPQAIPIFIDWLTHLEERIPGPEDEHRQAIRANLIRNLNDPAARGNADAIDALIKQLQRTPPLPGLAPGFAAHALQRIATKREFDRIAALLGDLGPDGPKGALIEYMGKVKTPQAQEIALHYLDTQWTYFSLKALIAMKTPGIHDRIRPYLQDSNATVRKYARKALETLPA
ncbi:hypothetical protein SAMN04488581_0007 [Mycolicibacterium neoaurum]|uniref:HEAT repeat domain-containing protein n=1 Tax=Mycolicibacterium neoaurum TaxID=1795 RepID=UPI00088FD8FE|nr:HEAT repeat domain-containing protein [Mycolicibacterium neoaurum]SDC05625.1 hypothetical protein SAMN04488581_0007 [Mycolicibacterium neoaurum]